MCATPSNSLNLAGVIDESIVNGPGLRMVVFTQGCPHKCPGCHNPETHAENGGKFHTLAELLDRYAENPLLDGMTFSGGEPFRQAAPLAKLAKQVHDLHGNIVTYTGYTLEALLSIASHDPDIRDLLLETDLLVDGPFIQALASLELPFRGSSNQRLIRRSEFIGLLA